MLSVTLLPGDVVCVSLLPRVNDFFADNNFWQLKMFQMLDGGRWVAVSAPLDRRNIPNRREYCARRPKDVGGRALLSLYRLYFQ